MRNKNTKKIGLIALILVVLLAIGSAVAYLTSRDEAVNLFTVGKVNVELTEPQWDAANPDGVLEHIKANQVITKDPTITNTGTNDAYVYIMVEIPKRPSVSIVGVDNVITVQKNYSLFSHEPNNGWTLVEKRGGLNDNNYDLYVYAYNEPLEKGESAKLFDEITFANVTNEFVDELVAEGLETISVKVTGYAIQRDFYNNEAKDAISAWQLFYNQNKWNEELEDYEKVFKVNYIDENGNSITMETVKSGEPLDKLYFDSSLAKEGYAFDWINGLTGEVAYVGMPVDDTITLTAHYTDLNYEKVDQSFIMIEAYTEEEAYGYDYPEIEEYFAYPTWLDETKESFPASGETVDVYMPETITFTVPENYDFNMNGDSNQGIETEYGTIYYLGTSKYEAGKTYTVQLIPEINALTSYNNVDSIVISDAAKAVGIYGGYSDALEQINIPFAWNCESESNYIHIEYCDNLKNIKIPNSVKSLNYFNIAACAGLEKLTIPNGVTTTGGQDGKFYNCTGLKELTMPASMLFNNGDFTNCTNIEKITLTKGTGVMPEYTSTTRKYTPWYISEDSVKEIILEEGITNIGEYTFNGICLDNLTIPSTVKTIGDKNFDNDPEQLVNLNYLGELKDWCEIDFVDFNSNPLPASENVYFDGKPFGGNIVIPDGITEIKPFAFCVASSVTGITIPDSVTAIGESAFEECLALESIIAGSGLKMIGEQAFRYCETLKNISLESAESIERMAFANCTSLEDIVLPENTVSFGTLDPRPTIVQGTFLNCTSLKSVKFEGEVKVIPINMFSGCTSLSDINIPDSVTAIRNGAFQKCTSLTSISIPDSVTSLGTNVFAQCTGLSTVKIGKGISTLSNGTFQKCTSLTNIELSDNITSIGSSAFNGCTDLSSITIPSKVANIGTGAFNGCTSLTSINIPKATTLVDTSAFLNCSAITDVYYEGSEEEWALISFTRNNEVITSATIHYNS